MVLGDAAGPVSQLTREHRYRPGTSHGVSLRPRRTRVKRSLGRGRDLSYVSTRWRLLHTCAKSLVLCPGDSQSCLLGIRGTQAQTTSGGSGAIPRFSGGVAVDCVGVAPPPTAP